MAGAGGGVLGELAGRVGEQGYGAADGTEAASPSPRRTAPLGGVKTTP